MNRRRGNVAEKNFVSGGILNVNTPIKNGGTNIKEQQQKPEQSVQQKQANVKEDSMAVDTSDLVDTNGKLKFKKIFLHRKKASVRIKEKRIRQNRGLRRTIVPKNALMALNELKGISIGDFNVENVAGGGFTATVTVNNSQYEGRGNSKSSAKNNACEKALRDIIIAKLRNNPRNQQGGDPMDTSNDDIPNSGDDSEEVPMINLASFAIYKLFSDWESEGYVIPELHPSTGGITSDNEGTARKLPNRNDLPPNWKIMHPSSLLFVMRPGVIYVDKGTIGEKPNVLQSLAVTVDDHDFQATGRAKKLARRNVAALVCNTLFNTNFELDVKGDSNGTAVSAH